MRGSVEAARSITTTRPPGSTHAHHLGQRGAGVDQMVQEEAGEDEGERRVGERQVRHLAAHKLQVGQPFVGRVSAARIDHRRCAVDDDDTGDTVGQRPADDAGPAGHVEHDVVDPGCHMVEQPRHARR